MSTPSRHISGRMACSLSGHTLIVLLPVAGTNFSQTAPETSHIQLQSARYRAYDCDFAYFITKAANKKAYPYIPSNWDPYDILVPTCPDGLERAETAEEVAEATAHVTRVSAPLRRLHEQANNTYNPCISRWTSIYMNRPDVVKALHADSHVTTIRTKDVLTSPICYATLTGAHMSL